MSSTLTGDPDNFWTGITAPSDGDGPIKAADVKVPFQALIDNDAHLEQLVVGPWPVISTTGTHTLALKDRVVVVTNGTAQINLPSPTYVGEEHTVVSDISGGQHVKVRDFAGAQIINNTVPFLTIPSLQQWVRFIWSGSSWIWNADVAP